MTRSARTSRPARAHHVSAVARAKRIGKKHPHKGVKGKHSKASLHLKHRQRG